MSLRTGYTNTFVADGREEAVKLAQLHLTTLLDRGDPAVRTECNRSVRNVKSIRPVKTLCTEPKTFTVSGVIYRDNEEPLTGCWHVKASNADDAAAVFDAYVRAWGGKGVLAAVIKGKQVSLVAKEAK